MTWKVGLVALIGSIGFFSCQVQESAPVSAWELAPDSAEIVDEGRAQDIFRALDAAKEVGTDPSISGYPVRAATTVEIDGDKHVIIGGNTEYQVPEAIHAETSLLNHVANRLGAEATRSVRFLAFYTSGTCGTSLSCGDCRDYQIQTTDYENLLVACGQGSDQTVRIRRFADAVVHEHEFPSISAEDIPLSAEDLERLVAAASGAREQGIRLFTSAANHAGAAALSHQGNVYRAAGADDAAFHYRYPIGGVLQQAASEGDYFIQAILVSGEAGSWPRVSYRERQYGFESSSFNQLRGMDPIQLILTDGQGSFRMTTFEEALPHAFSTNSFMPDAVEKFLEKQAPSADSN